MNRYLTTTLPYVNADPHIGFAVELLQADVTARAWRAQGDTVFFTTGVDEHGQKVLQKAQEAGEPTQEYVDRYAARFEALGAMLTISNDAFIRTTSPHHKLAAQALWKRCADAGAIYKKAYQGLYCVGDEAFVKESDLVEGKCPNHPTMEPVVVEEENYFFALSKYENALLAYLDQPTCILPEWRRTEARAFVAHGLEDISISREAARMSWGIPVPGDDTQVMYVWFDALTNYISTLGWPADEQKQFEIFWSNGYKLQMAGKDQVRFQSIIWQAMLMAAELPATDAVFYHGFITSGGQKMSKSLGNVIAPSELVDKYAVEATRYLLLRHVHPTEDTDVTWERLDEWYTANLANGLGNLAARVMTLAEKYLPEPVVLATEDTALDPVWQERIQAFAYNEALDFVFSIIGACDQRITAEAPFKKVKSEDEAVRAAGIADITGLVKSLATIATHIQPFMPATSIELLSAIADNRKPENLFPRLMDT